MSNNKNNEFKNKKNSFEFFSIPTEEENKNLINNNYKFEKKKSNENIYDNIIKLNRNFKGFLNKQNLGNMITFFNDEYGNPYLILNSKYYIYLFSLIIINIIYYKSLNKFLKNNNNNQNNNQNNNNLNKILSIIFLLLFNIFYLICLIINPGFPNININSTRGKQNMKYCDKCEIWFAPNSNVNHCIKCDICIEGYLKHNKLIGKCIGNKNKKSYFLYNFFIIINIFYLFYIIIFKKL